MTGHRDVEVLDAGKAAEMLVLPFNYAADLQGATRNLDAVAATGPAAPTGFFSFARSAKLPAGRDFDAAVEELLHWQVQRRAGLGVAASSDRIGTGVVAVLSVGPPRPALHSPVRVVYVVDEPDRQGFAYGTLQGHPESGEESFVLQRDASDAVTFTVTAFSRPGTWLTRVAGPIGRVVQHAITDRYLRTFDGQPAG